MTTEPQVNFEDEPNQLAVIVKESNLPETKAKYILTKFQDYFTFADELAKTTLQIKVTDASQTHLMDMARAARLTIREKRLALEKGHKEIKADVLREGRAIDGIKNVLLALLEPLENYYDKQENFVKYQEAEKAELIRLEVEKRIEEEMAEAARIKEQEDQRIREENETLKEQAYQKEKELAEERKANEAKIAAERAKVAYEQEKLKKENEAKIEAERKEQQRKLDLVRKEQEEKLAKERAERAAVEAELRAKREAEAKAERERVAKEEALKKAGDREKLLDVLENIKLIHIPIDLKSRESHIACTSVQNLLEQAENILKIATEEEVDF
jgi:hypothetical protein